MLTSRVAIVGGGITGAIAASALDASGAAVTLFDQGRRGPGGRSSHRSVDPADGSTLPDTGAISSAKWEFDHGCQFVRADTARMRGLMDAWCANGWAARWNGRFGRAGPQADPPADFFGLPSRAASPVYVGYGGMHRLPRAILAASSATVRAGVRVTGVDPINDDGVAGARAKWMLRGVEGVAAFHDTPEAEAKAKAGTTMDHEILGRFDAVLFTDISSSFGTWHRASAGVPDVVAAQVRERVRVPMFSCMVVLPTALRVPLDGFVSSGALWWASRNSSKPGQGPDAGDGADSAMMGECWTLVSTPEFAAAEIEHVPMRDAATGSFRPQEKAYLNSGPGAKLYAAFVDAVTPLLPDDVAALPAKPLYLQAQRWGSALPAPAGLGGRDADGRGESTRVISGVAYETEVPPLVHPDEDEADEAGEQCRDFIADDAQHLYYAGDFCSRRSPGFEAACLSGLDAAVHIAEQLHCGK